MPTHTKSKTSESKKAGSASVCGAGRSATGRPLGKAGIRALTKNAECVEQYIDLCDDTAGLERASLILARVTRTVGGGRVVVQLMDGTEDVSVPIGGSIKMKGKAATKTDRSNCMCQGDLVVVRGGIAAGKLSAAAAAHVSAIFAENDITVPRGFFGSAAATTEDDAFEFDRTEQLATESAEVEVVRAAAARKAALRHGAEEEEEDAASVPALDIDAI